MSRLILPPPRASKLIAIPYRIRNQHIYIPGKTRHGKSTVIHAMAYQDIRNGCGVCVIDPKGDLVSSLVQHIPEARKDDCVYLSTHSPVPLDFLDYKNDGEKETLVGELKYVITRGMSAESAPLMDAIITDLVYTLLDARENMPADEKPTFLDIHYFLSDEERRERILQFVKDADLKRRWKTNFPNPKECAPTLTRMTQFVRNPSLKKVFDCPQPSLNVADIMDNRKILLVDLGGISESTKILATLLIAKIRQAAFRRAAIKESERVPFFLYVDEFEFFQTSDFEHILSFAGGYGLRLTLANQFIGQLETNIRQSIFGNVGSFIVFCVSPEDARYFKHIRDGEFVAQLPKYEALFKIAGQDPVIKKTPEPAPPATNSYADYIRNRTKDLYSCKSPSPSHNSGDGKSVLPHEEQTRSPEAPHGVFRSPDKGPRPPYPGKGTQRKRYPDDKPDPQDP